MKIELNDIIITKNSCEYGEDIGGNLREGYVNIGIKGNFEPVNIDSLIASLQAIKASEGE